DDDAHVIVFPRIGRVRRIMKRTVEINVVVVIAVEKIAEVQRTAQTNEILNRIRMTKRDVGGVISAETRTARGHTMTMTFAPCVFEHLADNHVFVSVMRFHPIGWMNSLVVKTVEIDRVRAVNRDFSVVDVPGDGIDQTKILVLVITTERGWK